MRLISKEDDDKKIYVCDRNEYESLESVDTNAVYLVVQTTLDETRKE